MCVTNGWGFGVHIHSHAVTVQVLTGLVVAAVIIVRQLRGRPVRARAPVILNLVLLGYGTFVTVAAARSAGMSAATVGLLAAALVLAAGTGVLRAVTIRVYLAGDGMPWRRGGVVTVVVWVLGVGAHLGLGHAIDATTRHGGLGLVTIFLYLCVTLMTQNAVLRARARRLHPAAAPVRSGERLW